MSPRPVISPHSIGSPPGLTPPSPPASPPTPYRWGAGTAGGADHTTPTPAQHPVRIGRLQQFWEKWRDLLPESPIFHNIRAGVRWQFISHPTLSTTPIQFFSREDQRAALKEAAQGLVDKGAVDILPVEEHNTPGFYSQLFLRPKPTGELRPIIDLSRLNQYIHCPPFKMETVQSIRKSLQPGEWCTQIDIKDAYLHVPIQKRFQKYLRFTVDGVVYQFKSLPFGLNVAPRIFTLILKPVLAHLRRKGIRVHGYLDDWINRGLFPDQSRRNTAVIIQLLTELGWVINWDKSILDPNQDFIFLGLLFDLLLARVSPGPKGLGSLVANIRALKPGTRVTARVLLSLIGKVKHWAPYTPRGRLQLRLTQEWLKRRWTQSRDALEQTITIDATLIKQLHWWTLPKNTSRGVPLHAAKPTQDLFTDASNEGWGASLGSYSASGMWGSRTRTHHINRLELQAVYKACLHFQDQLRGKVTRVHIDNTTAVAYIRKEGGTCSHLLTQDTRKLLLWCDRNRVTLVPVHISGVRNVQADRLSRAGQLLSSEWSLSKPEFQRVCVHLGIPTLDLFATAENRVVPRFFAPTPHPEALAVDALSRDWPRDELLYAYPPTALVQVLLQKVRQEPGLVLILIASMSPTKPWHADLLSLSLRDPLPVARSANTLWQVPSGETERQYHSSPELFQLGAWFIRSPT